MILALLDYWKYRKRKGRYSHQALTKQGLQLATLSNFQNYKSYPLGHLLFASTTGSTLSWTVMYCTNSTLSHTAMFYGNGILQDCTTSGVIRHSFENYLDGESYLRVIPPPRGTDLAHTLKFMNESLGARYNWPGLFRLFSHILIGNHLDFSWRIYFDVLLTLIITSWLTGLAMPLTSNFIYLAAVIYSVVVVINRALRRKVLLSRA
jgi:hypothetical protein